MLEVLKILRCAEIKSRDPDMGFMHFRRRWSIFTANLDGETLRNFKSILNERLSKSFVERTLPENPKTMTGQFWPIANTKPAPHMHVRI